MRKHLILAAASVFATVLALPAMADVFLTATITKTKDVAVIEAIVKVKNVVIAVVTPPFVFDSAAEASVLVNARNQGGQVNGFFNEDPTFLPLGDNTNDPLADYGIFLTALIDTSVNANAGIVGLNQDVGNMANQGNVLSMALTGRGPVEGETLGATSNPALTHSQAAVDQKNDLNTVYDSEFLNVPGDPTLSTPNKTATISDSVTGNAGVVGVNQNAGNFVNQHNAVAFAVGFEGVVALSEASLGQQNTNNSVIEIETVKFATISNSGNGNAGIVGINQNTGNNNNQAHVVSASALTSFAVVGVPFGG